MSESVSELAKYVHQGHIDQNEHEQELTIDNYVTYSPVLCLDPQTSITVAANTMLNSNISGAPVVNSSGKLLGFLSEKDCLKHAYDEKYNQVPSGVTKDYMTKQVVVCRTNSPLFEAVDLFLKLPFHVYPVIDEEGKVVGVLQRSNILKAICDLKTH
ncbi:MAG: CBS domain-containing protein [Halobacteriovoraceae bacterium]|nr:CBS domain-containing protein [Halobacteriovoraceae bacterium]